LRPRSRRTTTSGAGLTDRSLFLVCLLASIRAFGDRSCSRLGRAAARRHRGERLLDLLPGVPESRAELPPRADARHERGALAGFATAGRLGRSGSRDHATCSRTICRFRRRRPYGGAGHAPSWNLATASAAVARWHSLQPPASARPTSGRSDHHGGRHCRIRRNIRASRSLCRVVVVRARDRAWRMAIWMRYARWAYVSAAAALVPLPPFCRPRADRSGLAPGRAGSVPLTGPWFDVNATVAIGAVYGGRDCRRALPSAGQARQIGG